MKGLLVGIGVLAILITPNVFAFWPFDSVPQTDPNIVTVRQQDSVITYDKSKNTGSWQSAPKWLLDYTDWRGNPIYVPYKIWDSSQYVTFENAQSSVTIEKSSCSLKIFDGVKVDSKEIPLINSISFNLQSAKNGTDIWNDSLENTSQCNVSYQNTTNGLVANMVQGDLVQKNIQLNLFDNKIPELILKVTNNDYSNIDTKYGYSISISNSLNTVVDGDLIKFLDNKGETILVFDTQNSINHYLWTVKKLDNGLILDYKNAKGPLSPGQTLEIDPTFTANPSPNVYNLRTGGTITCGSYSSTSTSAGTMTAFQNFGGSNGCGNSAAEFDISSFPATGVISSVQLGGTVSQTASVVCAFVQDLDRPSTTAGATLYNYIGSSTVYVNPSCGAGTTKINLGSTAKTDFVNQISSQWFGVGFRYGGSGTDATFSLTNTQLLVNYTLPVPNPVTGVSCIPSQALGITCSWNNST